MLPLIRLKNGNPDTPAIAVLACKDGPHYIGLFLHYCSKQTALPLYAVGLPASLHKRLEGELVLTTCNRLAYASPPSVVRPSGRLVQAHPISWPDELGLTDPAGELVAEWAEIYISHIQGGFPAAQGAFAGVHSRAPKGVHTGDLPLVPRWNVARLAHAGFTLEGMPPNASFEAVNMTAYLRRAESGGHGKHKHKDDVMVTLKWRSEALGRTAFAVHVSAEVSSTDDMGGDVKYTNVRAGVTFGEANMRAKMTKVNKWEGGRKSFKGKRLHVRLMFSFARRKGVRMLEIAVG